MAVFNGVFPILPGKVDAARSFASEVLGSRRADFDATQKEQGITRETWSIQETPDGNAFAVVWFECPDPEASLGQLAQDSRDFAVWFRGKVNEINGVDLAAGDAGPMPELILDWSA